MRVCCGLTNHLELAKRPDLYGGPVVVGEWEEHVIAASEEASLFGVVPGMPLRQAEHLCPQATFLAPDPDAAANLRELISSALYDLAPVVAVHEQAVDEQQHRSLAALAVGDRALRQVYGPCFAQLGRLRHASSLLRPNVTACAPSRV